MKKSQDPKKSKKTKSTLTEAEKIARQQAKEKREQLRLERAIRFSKKAKEEMSPEEKERLESLSNRERKAAYMSRKRGKHSKNTTEESTADSAPVPRFDKKRPPTKFTKKKTGKREEAAPPGRLKKGPDEGVRLNKYIANAGVAARRKADELIKAGQIKVNGQVVLEMGHKLQPSDVVTYKGKRIQPVNHVYILLNKPKDYITSVSDERNRKTVMDLIAKATTERVYPVGRLDRQTTGLLLFTNDGDLALKLSHPSKGVRKIYEVELNKAVTKTHLEEIAAGIELEDGKAYVDDIAYPYADRKNIVGITLHIGKNRIVRRIFEHLGYEVVRLDRTSYAGLTKKDLPRGRWRHLNPRELVLLKHMGKK